MTIHYCSRCVTPSTRPRLTFNSDGVCGACTWHDYKQTEVDWMERGNQLMRLCAEFRHPAPDGHFDCLVPVSGGKDGTFVAHRLRDTFGMTPLTVTFAPQLQTHLGRVNLDNFRNSGFSHILITPDARQYRRYAKDWFVTRGMPKQPFVVGISTSVLRLARLFGIRLVVWGEQGELEYGGDVGYTERFTRDFLITKYYEGQSDSADYGPWWQVPTNDDLSDVYSTWYSLYEDWDPDTHAREAKVKANLQMVVGGSIGTFTCASQLDDVLQDLHTYLQFVKFGFGRCTSDASIEIRRGRLTRDQGVKVVSELDGQFPLEYLPAYLSYFDMTETEFWRVISRHADKDLLRPSGLPERPWVLRQEVQ